MDASLIDRLATEVRAALLTGTSIAPFSSRYPDFSLVDGYRVAARLHDDRVAHGEITVGRKIGFTNRVVWAKHGISAPIWGYLYSTTVHHLGDVEDTFPLSHLAEPRIEPEIVLHLAERPEPGMSEPDLLGCIDWISHGFEIVQSPFPGWVLGAADAVAAEAVHASLLLGGPHQITGDRSAWLEALADFSIELNGPRGISRSGHGRDALGSPVTALRFLTAELARDAAAPPLAAGEIVTTGTLTEAMPVSAGDVWTTTLGGIDLPGLRLRLE